MPPKFHFSTQDLIWAASLLVGTLFNAIHLQIKYRSQQELKRIVMKLWRMVVIKTRIVHLRGCHCLRIRGTTSSSLSRGLVAWWCVMKSWWQARSLLLWPWVVRSKISVPIKSYYKIRKRSLQIRTAISLKVSIFTTNGWSQSRRRKRKESSRSRVILKRFQSVFLFSWQPMMEAL